jgi:hypothetical protein
LWIYEGHSDGSKSYMWALNKKSIPFMAYNNK